ncbi:CapA family protein [Caulobacter sp.]|uniref:CapA family protein n=1 Tax=Caulobacter sp. TaxID=78 RepID=UPI0031DE44BD
MTKTCLLAALLATSLLSRAALAQDAPQLPARPSNAPQDFLRTSPKPASIKGPFTLVALGEQLYSHPVAERPDPQMQKVFALARSGDVAIANREGMFFDLSTFKGQGYGSGMLWGEASLGKDAKALGIDMLTMANNHSTDWGWEGLLESQRLLDEAGVVHAGGGATLAQARHAAVFDTPKGKVALVGTASSFRANAGANDRLGDVPSRPGISTLRLRKINLVTADQLDKVRLLAVQLASPNKPAPEPGANEITLGEEIYRLADKPGLTYEMDLYDHAGLLKAVRDGKDQSDLLAFTIHAHESPTGFDDDDPNPPDFLIRLAHDTIDAGADVFLGHGQHSMRGIEIYKGRPIFYGLGAFFIRGEIKGLQESALKVFPDATGHAPPPPPPERSVRAGGNPASWYDGMVATVDYDAKGKATAVKIYPLDLGNTYEPMRRGMPYFADPANAQRILANLQTFSAPFGTKIEIQGSVGVIRIP